MRAGSGGAGGADVERLLAEREEARRARDFARADAIRDEIARLGFEVRDALGGSEAVPKPRVEPVDPARLPSALEEPPSVDFSIHLLYEGFREDVERFLAGLEAHCARHDYEVVLVDNASVDGEWLEDLAGRHPRARVLRVDRELPWARARNVGLRASRGRIVVLVDLSIEPAGDVLAPLAAALADPSVGVVGPFGLVSEDLREFVPSEGPVVDAIEGYLLAARRELLARGLIDEKFKWYRHADIDLSFQIRSYGTEAMVASCPVVKHAHRGWEALDEEERAKRSRRNYYRLLDRWKDRHGILLSHRAGGAHGEGVTGDSRTESN